MFAVLGVVGGIGSGKSTVCRAVTELLPVTLIDGDRLGHEVLTESAVIEKLVRQFGQTILDTEGRIDRKTLGKVVWSNDESGFPRLKELEQIVHPRIQERMKTEIELARTSHQCGVLLDAAVMLESGWSQICDRIIFIDRPDQARKAAALARGWSEQQWIQREQSQWTLADKKTKADFVIDNSGGLELAVRQLMDYAQQEFQWG
ncbi:MAG: dephospho-CoA kinase [Planctomycetaceae bacterium]|nr:dephospho-CoA kinase [Planctomycetaceae bacterium]